MHMNDLMLMPKEEEVRAHINGLDFDLGNPWQKKVMDEARLLIAWSGVSAKLLISSHGTAAYPCGVIGVNRTQLDRLFGAFTGAKYQTAIFFALSHEFGHLSQFSVFGIKSTLNRKRIMVEAHADVLAGVWLAVRLLEGKVHKPNDLMAAGLKLKNNCEDYPTGFQRGALVQTGMQNASILAMVEKQVRDRDYRSIRKTLRKQDVTDLYGTARRTLSTTPDNP